MALSSQNPTPLHRYSDYLWATLRFDRARETYSRYPVLQTEDVAEVVLHVIGQPPHVQIHDVLMRPTEQPD